MAKGINKNNSTVQANSACWEVTSPRLCKATFPVRRNCSNTKKKGFPMKVKTFIGAFVEGCNDSDFLGSLPQQILVSILSKVDHSDLQHVLLVSKFFNEAALVARETHFLYCTPLPNPAFNCDLEFSDSDIQTHPSTPKQKGTFRSRLEGKKLSSLCIKLFVDSESKNSCDINSTA
ncbi:hypothetical protein HPP92_013643 [Vanilla planifolia]|uniref:F-box domain-containing protein n=1 Tax=Vanilla planifolia TaxID=51239 RepID=A0A835QUF4_VANPL|nr:hypothetical protein HPP92_014080 [Vanilla planifolia]KAG0478924.1 hypothetical protein HPP92_013643 [Vanilla planifolia]